MHNTGPLGCLPRELAIRNDINASDFDEYGCMKSLNEGAKAFNAKLNALCQELQSHMKNTTIVYVDVYSIKYNIIANSTSYGELFRICPNENIYVSHSFKCVDFVNEKVSRIH